MIIAKITCLCALFITTIVAMNWLPDVEERAGALADRPLAAMTSCGNAVSHGLSGALAAGGGQVSRAGKNFGVAPACRIDLRHAR